MAEINLIGKQLVEYYYETFSHNRAGLIGLYRTGSCLTWEGTPYQGATNIIEKLTSLPFEKVQHKVTTLDVQPSSTASSPNIIVYVTGLLVVDGSENPLQFGQVFHLVPEGNSFYVQNDIFRLNLA